MSIYRNIASSITIGCILTLFSASLAHAAAFPADYAVTYTIGEDGVTQVEELITITNETSDQYPSQYTLALENIAIENVTARDAKGEMRIETELRGEFTLITAYFNEVAFGQGNTLSWTLAYTTNSIAVKKGYVWDVTVPQIQRDERVRAYSLTIHVPHSFGSLDYSDPYPTAYDSSESVRTIKYTFDESINLVGATLSFGTFQLTSLDLEYHLENPKSFTAITEIALPPSFTPYQKVFINSLQPEPIRIRQDIDGNVFAQYQLKPNESLDVIFDGQILLKQKTLDEHTSSSSLQDTSIYLKEDVYWETNDQSISEVAETILTNTQSDDHKELSRAVYEYVTNTLSYDEKRLTDLTSLERKGAVAALQQPKNAVCTDYTDLTIALMRKMGIPAREINGYAFTENQDLPTITDVLHAWVQVYLPEHGWVNIDPTWGSTSGQNYFDRFDTKHVIFSIRGEDSQYPFPAGSYKDTSEDTQDVFVNLAEGFEGGTILSVWLQQWEERNQKLDLIDWLFEKIQNKNAQKI